MIVAKVQAPIDKALPFYSTCTKNIANFFDLVKAITIHIHCKYYRDFQ